MSELNELIHLSKKYIKPASHVLSRAFQNDPVIRWQIPDVSERLMKLQYVWKLSLHIGIKYGIVYGTSENLEGIALWRPPQNVNFPYWRYLTKGGFKLPFKFGIKTTKRIKFIKAVNDSLRNIYMKVPYWYFGLIGVDPKFQGQGFASKLIKPMLKHIDEEHLPIYLETTLEKNFRFFEYFGFKMLEEIIIPNTNIVSWSMIRVSKD
ncbi:MAG: GNAT family N-acetyltransferase [Candidatus Hermodarchaeota archaeon]